MVIKDALNSSRGKIVIGLVSGVAVAAAAADAAAADQFISLRACLNSASSEAVGSMTSITEAVPLFPESNPELDLPAPVDPGEEPIFV